MGLSKVAIIAAPTKESRATTNLNARIIAIFMPTLSIILQCQRITAITSTSLRVKASWLAWQLPLALRVFVDRLNLASRLIGYRVAILGRATWETKPIQRLRKKIMFEFFALLLGSCGNSLCLLLFWPGWWLLGLIWFIVRWLIG
ncbi:hypothetical protein F5Y11DRAFT_361634 [Daldinia sp. FL1419]|nr:hypothetical protein F5Y11DRAFT_361634 [Daldinia sp. FL1419]